MQSQRQLGKQGKPICYRRPTACAAFIYFLHHLHVTSFPADKQNEPRSHYYSPTRRGDLNKTDSAELINEVLNKGLWSDRRQWSEVFQNDPQFAQK